MGQFFKQYLEPIKLNDVHVDWKSMDLSYLMEGNYLRHFVNIVPNAKPVYGNDIVLKAYNVDGNVRILYRDQEDFERIAQRFGIFYKSKDGIPRTAYKVTVIMAMVMNPPMKKMGYKEPQEQLHRIRITLSSKSVKNLEKVCAYHVSGTKSKLLKLKGPVRMCLLFSRLPLGNLPVEKVKRIDKQLSSLTTLELQYVSTQLSNCLHGANDYYFRCKWTLLQVQSRTAFLYTIIGPYLHGFVLTCGATV
ncbi:hypothetical protein GIB67_021753 [Kingdonia uniflora]|uniref:Alpha-1,3-mannosyl-glycoprotein 2-beta-N-acetylglucosaminyltransferase n=1 Tax=Kingdonia uniflora TaxID=39325 RepID=A0A7J7M9K1_9MAGN|nr:hypothetical protein GIB67_021753 [Kingdonia uniflora]